MLLAPLQKLPNNEGNLGKIIVASGFEQLPKVQKITQSDHTAQLLNQSLVKILAAYYGLFFQPVLQVGGSVTTLGDLLDFGQLFK